jgi:formylglycine-generating enzyme required for sulfatase activity/cytochrome oxidase Cu insertion factor (SCO1/SenC/PrrC family)
VPGFDIEIPNVTLVNQDGKEINLKFLLDSDKPVIIDFISTTCTTICSTLSAGFSGLRDELGAASGSVQLVSISIDPEHDGPEQMKDYLAQYGSGEGWDFLTGSREDIVLVLRAFKFNPPDKGKISPGSLYIVGGPFSHAWVRINGIVGSDGLMTEVKRMRSEMDDYYYMSAKISEAVPDYEEYITRFPEGARLKEIEQLMNEAEDSFYTKTKTSKDYSAYKEYLTTFRNGRYVEEIKALLDKSYDTMMEFISVKGGCYQMGDSFGVGGKNERIVHEVCVDDFSIGKYDVTRGDFRKFVDDTGFRTEAENGGGCYDWSGKKHERFNWRSVHFPQDDRHPVVCVSWNDAVAFAEWLSVKTGKQYRLPTEAEWEYAARSGGKNEKFAGVSDQGELQRYANFCDKSCVFVHRTESQDDGHKFTSPVGSYMPNGLGLYDMTGNVLQWVDDWYGDMYYRDSPKDNPKGPDSGQYRMLRGGSWYMNPLYIRAAYRTWGTPAVRFDDIGFRLVSPAH